MRDQLLLLNQTLKRLLYEFLAVAHVLKNFLAKDEVSAVDAHAGARYLANLLDGAIGIRRDDVVAEARAHADETCCLFLFFEATDQIREGQVDEPIRVVRKEHLFAMQLFLDGFQSHADVGIDAGVGESDVPVMDVAME